MEPEQSKEIVQLLRELLKWQRFTAIASLKEILTKNLDKKEKLLVYESTNGINKREDIIRETGCSAGAISSWWMDWYAKGLVEKIDGGRYKKIISLSEIGIDLPKKPVKENRSNNRGELDIENKGQTNQQNTF